VAEFVTVASHPTVVRLDDLLAERPHWISDSYFVTAETKSYLTSMTSALNQSSGCGIFLIGQYGSGKSHFLAYLTQQIRDHQLASVPLKVITLSMLNYSANHRLEDIVLDALGLTAVDDRRDAWQRLSLDDAGTSGIVLVIDELSEFLRSKSDRAAFNEDIRFLQFMGEWAMDHRFWIIAAMQEQIEHTGDLEYALYRKIKDRYPIRYLLTPTHVQELIANSILVKRPGYAQAVDVLIQQLKALYPRTGIDLEILQQVYPLHPATLTFLEEVRDCFSQSRGVVDFTVAQLAGDKSRGIAAFSKRVWGSLITPDYIVDHFKDLFELQPEFLSIAQHVLPYYRENLSTLFETRALIDLAKQLIKLLIIVHVSPRREVMSPAEGTYWLLFSATSLDPSKNLKIVDSTLKKLCDHGRYIVQKQAGYQLNLQDDGGAELERRIQREISEWQGQDPMVFEFITEQLPLDGFNPFIFSCDQWQTFQVRWHFHVRHIEFYLGNTTAPTIDDVGLCLRLPWGSVEGVENDYQVVPKKMTMTHDWIELAAMLKLSQRVTGQDMSQRLGQRVQERLNLFQQQLRQSYTEATVYAPGGGAEDMPRFHLKKTFSDWLTGMGEWLLRRQFPAFERFSPTHGPLPKEAYRIFMRCIINGQLLNSEVDDYVKIIREAYLVRMGLLQRRGREYVLAGRLEKNDLIGLLLPLIEHQPVPRVIYQHLQQSIFGLVPDQIHVLLMLLVMQGELDLIKNKKSIREVYEIFPTPLMYDEIKPGCSLSQQQSQQLIELSEGLNITLPKSWTPMTQRQAIQKLIQKAYQSMERLQSTAVLLQRDEETKVLSVPVKKLINTWRAFSVSDNEFEAFQQFLYEIKSVPDFLNKLAETENFLVHVNEILTDIKRYRHLFSHHVFSHYMAEQSQDEVQAFHASPTFENVEALQQWLVQAKEIYHQYKLWYQKSHENWWQPINQHGIWCWHAPTVATLAAVGLQAPIQQLTNLQQQAKQSRCDKLTNLDFSAQCHCGFDGQKSNISSTLQQFELLNNELQQQLTAFFKQASIRELIEQAYQEDVFNTLSIRDYLHQKIPVPEINDPDLFEKMLAGVVSVQTLPCSTVDNILLEKTWEPQALLAALSELLLQKKGSRLRFISNNHKEGQQSDDLYGWCITQALTHGVTLPKSLKMVNETSVLNAVNITQVASLALQRLDRLNLPEVVIDGVLKAIAQGDITLSNNLQPCSLVKAAMELVRPSPVSSIEALALLSEQLYCHHQKMCFIDKTAWLTRLDGLAHTEVMDELSPVTVLLEKQNTSQWLILDGAGLVLSKPLKSWLTEFLPDWKFQKIEYAYVSDITTTDAFYDELISLNINKKFEKINVIDELLHQDFLPFEHLCHMAKAGLGLAIERISSRLDKRLPLLVFADHGFRISKNGLRYEHGGDSTLERVVPVYYFIEGG